MPHSGTLGDRRNPAHRFFRIHARTEGKDLRDLPARELIGEPQAAW